MISKILLPIIYPFQFGLFRIFTIIFAFTTLAISSQSEAEVLSNVAVFHRCYSQITSQRAKSNDPLLLNVASGVTNPIDACIAVLNRGMLTGSGNLTLANTSDASSKAVLSTFHRLHSSWFYSKDFPVISWPGHNRDIKDLYDTTTPALYFTRALFRPNTLASDAITTNDYLLPIRTNISTNVGPESTHPLSDFIFSTAFTFAPTGELYGVKAVGALNLSFPANPIGDPYRSAGSLNLYNTKGGGFLGTSPYIGLNLASIPSSDEYRTDGALKMHRRWGKAVYLDSLCRALPVVRRVDGDPFVVANSSTPFRKASACIKCHVSHDRISSVIRGVKILYVGKGDPTGNGETNRGGNFPDFHTVSQGAEANWPSEPDGNYHIRPTNGQLYFRNLDGVLVNQNVSSVSDLGSAIAAQDDYYVCLARRYYKYFTGIDVDTGDLGDPDLVVVPNSEDLKHRQIVVGLGRSLKTHQSLLHLISDILRLDHYKKSDFGVGSGIP